MLPEDEAALEFICASNYMYLLREYYIVFPAAGSMICYSATAATDFATTTGNRCALAISPWALIYNKFNLTTLPRAPMQM